MFPRDNAYLYDGYDHYRLRAPLDDGVDQLDERQMRRSVAAMCADLIAGFTGRGEADLVAEYAAIIPMLAVAGLIGVDVADGHELQRALIALFGSGEDSQAGNAGPHACPWALLAKMEARVALTYLFGRYPQLTHAVRPDELEPVPSFFSNSARAIPVHLTPNMTAPSRRLRGWLSPRRGRASRSTPPR